MNSENPRIAPQSWRGRYTVVVLLLILTIVAQAIPPDNAGQHVLPVLIQGITLLFIFWTSDVRRRTMVGGTVFVLLALLAAVVAAVTPNGALRWAPQGIGALMALIGPVVIVRYIQRQGRITLQSLWGALSIYLLAGLFFAYVFGIVAGASGQHFFVQNPAHSELSLDYVYFSFVTLTTVGYGDFTAAQNFGKMLAVSEALMGQLYLVGVVALLASNIGREWHGRLRSSLNEQTQESHSQRPAEGNVEETAQPSEKVPSGGKEDST